MIFSSVHPWNDTRIYHREAKTIQKLGYETTLYGIDSIHKPTNRPGEVQVISLPKKKIFKRIRYWQQFYKIAKKQNIDCMHIHDPELLILAYFIKRRTKIKVIFDMHEDFPAALKSKKIIGKSIPKWLILFIEKIEKKVLARLDAVIFAEKSYKTKYLELTTTKIDILNYPVKQVEYTSSSKNGVPTILYAGAMHEIRGFKEMLEVAKELNEQKVEFHLVLIGEVPKRLRDYSTAFIKEHSLEKKVVFTGRLDFEELTRYYQNATIGLALLHPEPNYLGSLPTKIFEYMSFGIPYVASDFPLWEKLVNDTKSGLVVDPRNIKKITSLIKTILLDVHLQEELGSNGRKAHLNEYNWEAETIKLDALYKELIEETKN